MITLSKNVRLEKRAEHIVEKCVSLETVVVVVDDAAAAFAADVEITRVEKIGRGKIEQ